MKLVSHSRLVKEMLDELQQRQPFTKSPLVTIKSLPSMQSKGAGHSAFAQYHTGTLPSEIVASETTNGPRMLSSASSDSGPCGATGPCLQSVLPTTWTR